MESPGMTPYYGVIGWERVNGSHITQLTDSQLVLLVSCSSTHLHQLAQFTVQLLRQKLDLGCPSVQISVPIVFCCPGFSVLVNLVSSHLCFATGRPVVLDLRVGIFAWCVLLYVYLC